VNPCVRGGPIGRRSPLHGGPSSTPKHTAPQADIVALLQACLAMLEKRHGSGPYRPAPLPLWRVPDALARLRRMLPGETAGALLERFLPEETNSGSASTGGALRRRAALASTLLAGLELEREGSAVLSQGEAFGAVRVAPAAAAPPATVALPRRQPGREQGGLSASLTLTVSPSPSPRRCGATFCCGSGASRSRARRPAARCAAGARRGAARPAGC
jgi:hypothetical protein